MTSWAATACKPDLREHPSPLCSRPRFVSERGARLRPRIAREMPDCKLCGRPLVAIGTARVGGAKHRDWKRRPYHKACFKKLTPPKPKPKKFKPRPRW